MPGPRRLPALPALAQDWLLAAFITFMQVQGTVSRYGDGVTPARPLGEVAGLGYVLLVGTGLAVAFRRRWPLLVVVLTGAASVAYYAIGYRDGPGWLGLFVALYTLTAYGDGRRSLAVSTAGIAVLTGTWLAFAHDVHPRAAIGWVFFRIGASVMSAALGESVRGRRALAAEALARAEVAERTREDEARARVDAERLRIAREVHDTVAHAIAVINVQSGVTAHVLDKRPEQAREALVVIERTSARALREMRAILGVLREAEGDRNPYPGVEQVDDLAAKARDAGLEIDLRAPAPPTSLPSAVDRAAFRIVQESLTNVIRHVGPTRVRVSLGYDCDSMEVRIVDNGRRTGPVAGDGAGDGRPGRGLTGMRERCELLGGRFSARPLPQGGFEVLARLPLEPTGATR